MSRLIEARTEAAEAPPPFVPEFIGRERELRILNEHLGLLVNRSAVGRGGRTLARFFQIHGLPGMGKTSLIERFNHLYCQKDPPSPHPRPIPFAKFDFVGFEGLRREDAFMTPDTLYQSLAEQLEIPQDNKEPLKALQDGLKDITEEKTVVLVFDATEEMTSECKERVLTDLVGFCMSKTEGTMVLWSGRMPENPANLGMNIKLRQETIEVSILGPEVDHALGDRNQFSRALRHYSYGWPILFPCLENVARGQYNQDGQYNYSVWIERAYQVVEEHILTDLKPHQKRALETFSFYLRMFSVSKIAEAYDLVEALRMYLEPVKGGYKVVEPFRTIISRAVRQREKLEAQI